MLRSALPVLYPRCTLALAGLLVSNTSFILAALALYWLGCLTLRDGDLALRAAYLFCFNPASVFFSGVYTEAVFVFVSWAGALSLCVESPWRAALAFSTAAATRSNGAHQRCVRGCEIESLAQCEIDPSWIAGVLCCLLLLWDSGRRISRLPRRPRDASLDRRAALLELVGVSLRCLLVCTPALLFQVRSSALSCLFQPRCTETCHCPPGVGVPPLLRSRGRRRPPLVQLDGTLRLHIRPATLLVRLSGVSSAPPAHMN